MHLFHFKGWCYHPEFLCALAREWGKKANKGETEMQTWNFAAQIPPRYILKTSAEPLQLVLGQMENTIQI